jgi:ferredoxin--NADP+ reductase
MSLLRPRDVTQPDERFYEATITSRVDFAPDLWMIRVRSGGEFNFVPGQFASLGLIENGKRIERPYSIASAPSDDEVEFFLELVPNGALTPLLHKLQVGDRLLMRKEPKGKFSLDTNKRRTNHLLVSTVTGVAPFVSYVRTLANAWKEGSFDGSHKLFLLNGASRPSEFGYHEELTQLGRELPWFEYVATVSRPWDHADWQGEIGRTHDILRKYADQWELEPANTVAYLCGNPEMIENSKAILKRRGFLEKGTVKEETYWIAPKC